jgi:hypothetical protein
MFDDDDSYQLDACGHRVLIGLSVDETAEFQRLDCAIDRGKSLPVIASDQWARAEDLRWLELYEKHQAARLPFLNGSKTMH